MTDDDVYKVVEVANATGKVRRGSNEVTKSVEKGEAKLIVIAKDVSPPEVIMHLPILAKEKGIKCVEVASKEELGAASGINKATTAVAIVQEGDAKKAIANLGK